MHSGLRACFVWGWSSGCFGLLNILILPSHPFVGSYALWAQGLLCLGLVFRLLRASEIEILPSHPFMGSYALWAQGLLCLGLAFRLLRASEIEILPSHPSVGSYALWAQGLLCLGLVFRLLWASEIVIIGLRSLARARTDSRKQCRIVK